MRQLILIVFVLGFIFNSYSQQTGTYTDTRDGKVYKTVTIGNLIWFAENLAYNAGSGCWAYDNDSSNITKYGYLYNYETAQNVCPSGWHLPSDKEWQSLETALAMSSSDANSTGYRGAPVGTNLKNSSGWNSNGNGNNQSGFAALPGGYRVANSTFLGEGYNGCWWSSTTDEASNVWSRGLIYNYPGVCRYSDDKAVGFSVRCVQVQ